jgi:hypothetical protein
MKLLKSKKFELPKVYFITDREEIKELPVGVPFIFGDAATEKYLVRILEYELLYQEAVASGYPFDFKKILRKKGYVDIADCNFSHPAYLEYTTEGLIDADGEVIDKDLTPIGECSDSFKRFIRDSAAYVDIDKLKKLNVFPVWLDTIEKAIHTNIHNFAVYNNNMYNKKLEGMYGAIDLVSPNKNLIVIDISGSIPKAVSATCLALAKNLVETFYADLVITGSKSTLYPYESIHTLDIERIYDENGMDNDQAYFKNLVTEIKRTYKTAIVFGDNHSPCDSWSNVYNHGTKRISREDGKKLCLWEIDKLISFHTSSTKYIAGYADWFSPTEVEHIGDWVKYLKR